MLVGLNTGSVDKNASRPEMNSMVRAYEVFVGSGRICAAGLERRER